MGVILGLTKTKIDQSQMKGIYVLLINVKKSSTIRIGALGKLKFEKGIYAYVGSAQNNLEKRIVRHLSKNKKLYWHIDYLLNDKNIKIKEIYYKIAEKAEECNTAKELKKKNRPIRGFGCSDCKCASHLFMINQEKTIHQMRMKKWNLDQD